jgi:hypothetical protein
MTFDLLHNVVPADCTALAGAAITSSLDWERCSWAHPIGFVRRQPVWLAGTIAMRSSMKFDGILRGRDWGMSETTLQLRASDLSLKLSHLSSANRKEGAAIPHFLTLSLRVA